ncbi:MAG TPA: PQQ-dependent sugar dehydrogenase, partial [Polyangiales bacterium]|nr:PQQ-dependent sugar dehydrogenase [Polyangiales bacterium]
WIVWGTVALLAIATLVARLQNPDEPGLSDLIRESAPPKPAVIATPSGQHISLSLEPIASGFEMPTDLQFVPGSDTQALVLEKNGRAQWLSLPSGTHGPLFHAEVVTVLEEGLLGAAFHPAFVHNGRLFLDYVRQDGKRRVTRIAEWQVDPPGDLAHASAKETKVLMEVEQPYDNHKAGALQFGPDGFLYIGFGDGGYRDDPNGNGQNLKNELGSMLRVDVDHADPGKTYAVPKDNPFVGRADALPETWAYGLRNPWRYSFDAKGRLIVADVGQDHWEEIDIVRAGDNLGWDVREGFACADGSKECPAPAGVTFVDPIAVYGREVGVSITGGYVHTGKLVPFLKGKYVFGDFASGALMALDLPEDRSTRVEPIPLGRFGVSPSTFGRDASGEIYVADFAHGAILRLKQVPAS